VRVVGTQIGRTLDGRADAFLRRRFGGPGLYGTPEQGWWPQLRLMLVCCGGVALLVVIALAVGGRVETAPRLLAVMAGLVAWYALCLTVVVLVRVRRARASRGEQSGTGGGGQR